MSLLRILPLRFARDEIFPGRSLRENLCEAPSIQGKYFAISREGKVIPVQKLLLDEMLAAGLHQGRLDAKTPAAGLREFSHKAYPGFGDKKTEASAWMFPVDCQSEAMWK
jgi:hypothetical protein